MKMLSLLFLSAFAAASAAAQAPAKLLATQSEITFVSKQMGVPVEGTFRTFDAQITLDARRPETGSVLLRVDTASATLGVPESDGELRKPGWFDVAKFTQASFRSSSIKALGGGKFEVSGKLAIKGTERPLVVPVAFTQAGANSTATGSFTVKRLDYGVGEGEWSDTGLVANDVQVKFKLVLTGIGPL